MKDVYIEWMVKKQRGFVDKLIRALSVIFLVICVLLFLLTANIVMFIATIVAGVLIYFAFTHTDVEYEYVYVTGEFSIDRILSRSKRKRIERFDVGRIEIVAPLNSDKLGGFAHKNYREYDYTSGVRVPGSHIFVMYCESKKILFEPNRDLVEALRNTLPHKVHMY